MRGRPVGTPLRHGPALALMVATATLWSTAGVVTRNLSADLQADGRFEITFWRSLFAAVFVAGYLFMLRREGLSSLRRAGYPGLLSGAMWATMFSCFMLALTLTSVANTLLVLSLTPIVTALLARAVLKSQIARHTWLAIAVATVGMGWMFARGGGGGFDGNHAVGMLIAFAVPVASSINFIVLQKLRAEVDLIPAIFVGGTLSALAMAPLAWPFQATGTDIAWLMALGFFQLGLPCVWMVMASRVLSATEIALLALVEVVLGPIWAWLGAGEVPATATLVGGALVLMALVVNEGFALRRVR